MKVWMLVSLVVVNAVSMSVLASGQAPEVKTLALAISNMVAVGVLAAVVTTQKP